MHLNRDTNEAGLVTDTIRVVPSTDPSVPAISVTLLDAPTADSLEVNEGVELLPGERSVEIGVVIDLIHGLLEIKVLPAR